MEDSKTFPCSMHNCGNMLDVEICSPNLVVIKTRPEKDWGLPHRIFAAVRYILEGEKSMHFRRTVWLDRAQINDLIDMLINRGKK